VGQVLSSKTRPWVQSPISIERGKNILVKKIIINYIVDKNPEFIEVQDPSLLSFLCH
jgi:hypothetical protein